jgi:hypothetical protein
MADADTGATGSYIATRDTQCLNNIVSCTPSLQISVQVANGQIITSSHEGELQVPDGIILKAFIFTGINGLLLSISQLVDVGYTVVYTKNKVAFCKGDQEFSLDLEIQFHA